MFGKKKQAPMYILFQTACGCSRMEFASPNFRAPPDLYLPVIYPKSVRDWINEVTDDSIQNRTTNRRFRLESENILEDGLTKVYTYRETEF